MAQTFVDEFGNVIDTVATSADRQGVMQTEAGRKQLYEQATQYRAGKLNADQIREMQATFKALGGKVETSSADGKKETKKAEVTGKKDDVTDSLAQAYVTDYEAHHKEAQRKQQADFDREDRRLAEAGSKTSNAPAAPHAQTQQRVAAPKPAEPKSLSPDELKQQEANAYLRVLGKKDISEVSADLKGKQLTSPEVIEALKAKVKGSPEAQAFARQMLEKDATTDRKPFQNLNGPDVVALQYMLKANGQDIGTFGPGKNGIDGILGDYTRKATESVASPAPAKNGPEAKTDAQAPAQAQAQAPAATTTQQPQPQQAQQQPPQPPMTAQPPAGAQLRTYQQTPYGQGLVQQGERDTISTHFTGQAAGGVMVMDPQTGIAYNSYTGRYMNPGTGHVINPQDRNRDGTIDRNEYTVAVYQDNMREAMNQRVAAMSGGMRPVLSPWTNGFPSVQERAYARADGMMTQRQVQMGYNDISRGVGALMDRNRYNDGQGIGSLIGGALKIFDPFGQQNPRGPRF